MHSQTVKEIIKDRGGVIAVAAALSAPGRAVHKNTVRGWVNSNRLPWWREDAVMALPLKPKEEKSDQQERAA